MEAQVDLTLRLGPPSAYYPQAPAAPASQFQNNALSALTQGFGSGASAGNAHQAAEDLTNRLLEFQRSVSISAITNQAIPAPMEMREFCLIDIPNRRGRVGGSKKRKTTGYVRREPKPEDKDRVCLNLRCLIADTPMWRRGPRGPKTLCNACGIKYRKGILKPKEEEGEEGTSGESSSYSA